MRASQSGVRIATASGPTRKAANAHRLTFEGCDGSQVLSESRHPTDRAEMGKSQAQCAFSEPPCGFALDGREPHDLVGVIPSDR
jgi:hypothetical protein